MDRVHHDSACDMAEQIDGVYCLISHIPEHYRIPDLRRYFTDFIENEKFVMFHYLRRPEVVITADGGDASDRPSPTCCCVVILATSDDAQTFVKQYNGREWFDKNEKYAGIYCSIKRIKKPSEAEGPSSASADEHTGNSHSVTTTTPAATTVTTAATAVGTATRSALVDSLLSGTATERDIAAAAHPTAPPQQPLQPAPVFQTRQEKRTLMRHGGMARDAGRLSCLAELHPPACLPRGNVGTPERVLLQLIAQCRIPTTIVQQLALPPRRAERPYAHLALD